MCVCVTGSFRRTFISIHSPDIYLFAIHETVRLQNHLNVAMPRKGGLWKMKGTKNHNQNTVLTLNIAENGPKKNISQYARGHGGDGGDGGVFPTNFA